MRLPNIKIVPLPVRRFAFALWLAIAPAAFAADAVFVFTGQHETQPSNWQQADNWSLDGESAGRVPGTGPEDVVTIGAFTVTNCNHTVKQLTINGGTLGLSGAITVQNMIIGAGSIVEGAGDITLTGQLLLAGGSLRGGAQAPPFAKLIVQTGATVEIPDHENGAIIGRSVENSGTFDLSSSTDLGNQYGALTRPTFNNTATGTVILRGNGGLGSRLLINAGTVRKSGSYSVSEGPLLAFACANSGLINVQNGLLKISALSQDAGELHVSAGAEARFQGTISVVSGGSFSGSGTIRTTSAASAVTFGGTLRPESSASGLTLDRTEASFIFTPSAIVEIEIGGLDAGTDYDRLTLNSTTGNFPLDGTLAVKFVNEFTPSPGQNFAVVNIAPGQTGTFGTSGFITPNNLLLVPHYSLTNLELRVAADPGANVSLIGGNSASITHNTATSFLYSLEYSDDLKIWYYTGSSFQGDGDPHTFTDNYGSAGNRFYRLRVEYSPLR